MFEAPWQNPAIWHAINVHFPIVLIVLGLPLVCILAITRGKSRRFRWGMVAYYVVLAGLAWYTVKTGERAMDEMPPTISQAAADHIQFHEQLAKQLPLLCGITALLLLLANIPRRRIRTVFTTLALVQSVVVVGWVTVAAHSGGLAVYDEGVGTALLNQPPSGIARAATSQPGAQASSRARESAVAPKPLVNIVPVSYTKTIKPLLEDKCAECHQDEIKGGFDISTIALMTKGGKKAGPGIIPGEPDKSPLVAYCTGHMKPRMPKGEDALTNEEIDQLRNWIAGGAKDDSNAKPDANAKVATSAPVAPVTQLVAKAVATATTAPATKAVSADWDPQVQFTPSEAVAVRRFVRLKNLPPPPAIPTTQATTFNPIDNFILVKYPSTKPVTVAKTQATTEASTKPTTQSTDLALCDDATFVRRIYLDIVGAIPTSEEAKSFIDSKDGHKRTQLVDALLARTSDYAANWVPFWEDALCSNGQHQGGVGTHGNYRQWIFDSFNANKPYDTFVQELLDPTMPNHPQRYILNQDHMRTIQSSADTAQVFLGTAIKCASCHAHFLNDEWPQARAVAFAGYFSDKDMELVRCERSTGQFIQTHFMFNEPSAPTTAPSDPTMRLKEVAQLITDPTNPRFARTMVNRLWKRYMGLGLFEPVDDFREDTPPSHPELLTWLADDFIRHGFDVKRTVRLILTSRTYQLKYDPTTEDHFDVAKPKEMRYFRSPALRRLTAEQLMDSISVAMEQKIPEKRAYQDDKSTPFTRSLGKPAARNEVSTVRSDDTAVVQALELLNGHEFHDRVYKGTLIDTLSIEPKVDELIDTMYLSTLSRLPSEKEKDVATKFIESAPATQPTTKPVEVVWFDDALPMNAKPAGNWKFVTAPDAPVFSGKQAHTEADPFPGAIQHTFTGVKFAATPKDVVFVYVYLDPTNPPKEIMLQLHNGKDWLRAAWGENVIEFKPKTTLGPLPKTGEWVRLEIPLAKLGVTKPINISGISFDQFAGKVYWDKLGAAKGPPIHDPQTIGDMLWALMTSPEFQYIK